MNLIDPNSALQLATDRRQQLLRERSVFARPHRLRRRPVADHLLPGSPPDAA